MNYGLYYNYHLLGDVLLVVINGQKDTTKTVTYGDITVIYHGDEIIGYNIFNLQDIVKIKSKGFIALPPNPLIDIINGKLKVHQLDLLPYKEESGFKVGKVLSLEDHPDSDHLHVCQVSVGQTTYQVVCGAQNVQQGQNVVVATPYCLMPDGTQIIPGTLRGVKSEAMLCSAKELHLEELSSKKGILVLEEKQELGRDFFERK